MVTRPSKIEQYLDHAKVASERGTCRRRVYGAVAVKDDAIVSTGYCGSPRGAPNCTDIGFCEREKRNIASGEKYELCKSVHAEANVVINAARVGVSVLDSTLYLYGKDNITGKSIKAIPCMMCKRIIINAGFEKLIASDPDSPDGYVTYYPKDLME
jgi:dCMP deaminase